MGLYISRGEGGEEGEEREKREIEGEEGEREGLDIVLEWPLPILSAKLYTICLSHLELCSIE